MDRIVAALCAYVNEFRALREPPGLERLKLHLLDTIGVAVAASGAPPIEIACAAFRKFAAPGPSTAIGHGRYAVDDATFLNGFMVKYLDFNDSYLGIDGGPPSDLIPAALAVGEAEHRSGAEVLRAIAAAYGIYCSFNDAAGTQERGWDSAGFTTVGSAVEAGILLGLSGEQMAHAIALAVIPHVAMLRTKSGKLSNWKGAATADGTAHGVRAAYFAAGGMTGPDAPFEGRWGVMEQVSGPFELILDPKRDRMGHISIKTYPCGYYAHPEVDLALELRSRLGEVAEGDLEAALRAITAVEIRSHRAAQAYADLPDKWSPTTHETADHSIPFTFSLALARGPITYESIERGLDDQTVLELTRKVRFEVDPELTRKFPALNAASVRIHGPRGILEGNIDAPLGHFTRPLQPKQCSAKFHANADRVAGVERATALETRLLRIDGASDVAGLLEL